MNFSKTTDDRFVAYFDIMGFKDLVYRNNHEHVNAYMDKIIEEIDGIKDSELELLKDDFDRSKYPLDRSVVLPVMFSDSILFISESNTIFDAQKMVFTASFFLERMFLIGVPIKGALSAGTFTADFQKSKFFGRPLVDAYLLTEDVHFYGALLHHTFDKYLFDKKTHQECLPGFFEKMLDRKPVPLKNGKVTHSILRWSSDISIEGKIDPQDLVDILECSVSGCTRKYIDNTRDVYFEDESV